MAERTRRKPAANPPITSHPLFPVTVILWFGALFGLASVAIRPALIEHAVLVAGIDRVIPMAAPPLGTTTRILLALMMTGIGCVLGAIVARLVANPRPQTSARRRRPAAEVDGASPVALFGASDNSAPEPIAQDTVPARRRQLTTTPEAEPIDEPAPLPGASPILNVADLEIDSFDAELEEGPWMRRPVAVEPESEVRVQTEGAYDEAQDDRTTDDDLPVGRTVFGRRRSVEAIEPAEPARANRLFDAYVRAPRPAETAEAVPAPGFESLPRVDEAASSQWDEGEEIAPAQAEAQEAPASKPALVETPAESLTAAQRIASAPLDALSPVELLERLALTIARRRAAASREIAEPNASVEEPEAPTHRPLPAALRPVRFDEDANDGDTLPGYVPPRHIGSGHISLASASQDRAADDEDALASGYASLRDLSKPEALTGSDIVSFPTQSEDTGEPASPATARAFDGPSQKVDQTEEALRAALATLQRMSGAA